MKLSDEQLREVLRRNATLARRNPGLVGLPASQPQSSARLSLEPIGERETPGGVGAPGRYRITFRVYARRPQDWDNPVSGCKRLQDLLVTSGFLPCDDWKSLEGSVISLKAETKKEERTEIEITRIA